MVEVGIDPLPLSFPQKRKKLWRSESNPRLTPPDVPRRQPQLWRLYHLWDHRDRRSRVAMSKNESRTIIFQSSQFFCTIYNEWFLESSQLDFTSASQGIELVSRHCGKKYKERDGTSKGEGTQTFFLNFWMKMYRRSGIEKKSLRSRDRRSTLRIYKLALFFQNWRWSEL